MDFKLIKKPKLEDYQEIIKVLNEVFADFPNPREYSGQVAFDRMKTVLNPLAIKAISSGRIVGFALGYERYPNYYHFWQLGVLPKFRGSGIATKIYEILENFAKEKGYKGVTLNTFNDYRSNIRLLIKRGYKIYDLDKSGDYAKNPALMFRLNF